MGAPSAGARGLGTDEPWPDATVDDALRDVDDMRDRLLSLSAQLRRIGQSSNCQAKDGITSPRIPDVFEM